LFKTPLYHNLEQELEINDLALEGAIFWAKAKFNFELYFILYHE
jgi:hypothetical protein